MSGLWERLQPDTGAVISRDGAECLITPIGGEMSSVMCFWDGLSLEGGERGGWQAWVAAADLPTTLPQGSALVYPASNGTTYHISHKEPDGHGLMLLTLVDESEL
jgi:hypothetical protein